MTIRCLFFSALTLTLIPALSSCAAAPAKPSPSKTSVAKPAALQTAAAVNTVYGRRIVVPAATQLPLREAIEDLKSTLSRITGQEFQTVTEKEPLSPGEAAIVVVRSTSPSAPADAAAKLKGRGREPFLIRSQNASRLYITANGEDGLSHGIYYYLEQLGCRWLLPGDNWIIVPQRKPIGLTIDRMVAPAFKTRSFFGTGGFGPRGIYDRGDAEGRLHIEKLWTGWQRRNRFGGEYRLSGHAGEDFNLRHKATLLAHPEYLAEVNGKREWSESAKLDPTNADAVKLWVEDRLNAFRAQRLATPEGPFAYAVSVEPADGGGYCQSEECKKRFPTASDQTFYLANEVAKAVRKEFPDGYVSLYGYADNSMPPSFPLEPNVVVQITPYGFNYSGLGPEDFIKLWATKTKHLSVYDYWAMPDWNWDEPSFDYLNAPREKLNFWKNHSVEGLAAESTYSAGAMGVAWYLTSRLMWDPQADQSAILQEFYDLAFGAAAPPMKRILERWTRGFLLSSHELGLSFRDLQEAQKLAANNAAVQSRIDDYARYVQYLRLRYEAENAPDAEAKVEVEKKIVEHLFDNYNTAMLHVFRLYYLYTDYGRKTSVYNDFIDTDPNAPGWKRVAPLSHQEVAALIASGVQSFQPLGFEARSYRGKLTPLPASAFKTPSEAWSKLAILNSYYDFDLYVPSARKVKLKIGRNPEPSFPLIVTDEAGREIVRQEVPAQQGKSVLEGQAEVEFSLPKAGHYVMRLGAPGTTGFSIMAPTGTGLRLMTRSLVPYLHNGIYFYVPRGLKKVALWIPQENGTPVPVISDADGRPAVTRTSDKFLMVADVPPGQDGRVWSISNWRQISQPIRALNVPAAFSFSPDTLTVPQDALR